MERLLKIGFIKVGYWELQNGELKYILDPKYREIKNVLYSFTCRGRIKYIGKTANEFWIRLYGYQKPGESQSTNNVVNYEIFSRLSKGQRVNILILIDKRRLSYFGYKISLADALENTLIQTIKPDWNRQGTDRYLYSNNP